MMNNLQVFIGYDDQEPVAYHVLAHSLMRHASRPLTIHPLIRRSLRGIGFTRPRDRLASTDFADTRFLVPHLATGRGYAVFMDCDMLARGDIYKILEEVNPRDIVTVRKHSHLPGNDTKFAGHKQTWYPKKNWSSLMVFNLAKVHYHLPAEVVETASGLQLHQFEWCPEDSIGGLSHVWNLLVGDEAPLLEAELVHFTNGTPCFPGYDTQPYATEWFEELQRLTFPL